MNWRTFLPILTLLIGLGAGMVLTKSLSPSKNSAQTEQSTASKKSQRATSRQNRSEQGDGPSSNSSPSKVSVSDLESLINLLDEAPHSFPPAEFFAAIKGLNASEISQFIDELKTSFLNDSRSYRLRETLFKQLALIDPQGAWAKANTLKNYNSRSHAIGTVAGVLSLIHI